MKNRLQFRHDSKLYSNLNEIKNVLSTSDQFSLYGEPIVFKYGTSANTNMVLAIGTSGDDSDTSQKKYYIVDFNKINTSVADISFSESGKQLRFTMQDGTTNIISVPGQTIDVSDLVKKDDIADFVTSGYVLNKLSNYYTKTEVNNKINKITGTTSLNYYSEPSEDVAEISVNDGDTYIKVSGDTIAISGKTVTINGLTGGTSTVDEEKVKEIVKENTSGLTNDITSLSGTVETLKETVDKNQLLFYSEVTSQKKAIITSDNGTSGIVVKPNSISETADSITLSGDTITLSADTLTLNGKEIATVGDIPTYKYYTEVTGGSLYNTATVKAPHTVLSDSVSGSNITIGNQTTEKLSNIGISLNTLHGLIAVYNGNEIATSKDISGVTTSISEQDEKIKAINQAIIGIASDVSTNTSDISDLKDAIKETGLTYYSENESGGTFTTTGDGQTIKYNGNEIATVKDISDLKGEIGDLTKITDDIEYVGDIDSNPEDYKKFADSGDTLTTALQKVAQGVMEEMISNEYTTSTAINKWNDKVTELTETVNSLQTLIANLTTRVENLEKA